MPYSPTTSYFVHAVDALCPEIAHLIIGHALPVTALKIILVGTWWQRGRSRGRRPDGKRLGRQIAVHKTDVVNSNSSIRACSDLCFDDNLCGKTDVNKCHIPHRNALVHVKSSFGDALLMKRTILSHLDPIDSNRICHVMLFGYFSLVFVLI